MKMVHNIIELMALFLKVNTEGTVKNPMLPSASCTLLGNRSI
jgi:hypothetical protein